MILYIVEFGLSHVEYLELFKFRAGKNWRLDNSLQRKGYIGQNEVRPWS